MANNKSGGPIEDRVVSTRYDPVFSLSYTIEKNGLVVDSFSVGLERKDYIQRDGKVIPRVRKLGNLYSLNGSSIVLPTPVSLSKAYKNMVSEMYPNLPSDILIEVVARVVNMR